MRIRTLLLTAGVTALVAISAPAHAARGWASFSPNQTSLAVGGGVTDFALEQYRSRTGLGGAWDARLTFGTRSIIAFELGYVGTAQKINDPFGDDPTLASNAVVGSARINLTTWRVQPFITGGAGWINYHSYGGDDAPLAQQEFRYDDSGVVLPVGGGVASYLGRHLLIDARFDYRFVPTGDDDLVTSPSTVTTQRPDNWTAMARVGYAF